MTTDPLTAAVAKLSDTVDALDAWADENTHDCWTADQVVEAHGALVKAMNAGPWSFHQHRQHPRAVPVFDVCLHGVMVGQFHEEEIALAVVGLLNEHHAQYPSLRRLRPETVGSR